MVWDLRPRMTTVRSISNLPLAGLAYAVGSKPRPATTGNPSRTSSPPPEYDHPIRSPPSSTVEGDPISSHATPMGPAPDELERALTFRRLHDEQIERSRYASQGAILLRSSQDSSLSAQTADELRFARELYLTSLDYILRGVPTELTEAEKDGLERSVDQLYRRVGIEQPILIPGKPSEGVAKTQQLFVQICRGTAIMIKLSIPHIKQGLESAIEFEKQHHVLERSGSLVSTSLLTIADRASKTTVPLPDLSRLTGIASGILNGLSIGVWEGYRILAEQQVVEPVTTGLEAS